jgi:hypothetical protein
MMENSKRSVRYRKKGGKVMVRGVHWYEGRGGKIEIKSR